MTLQLKRFDWIASGQNNGPDVLCDVPLYLNSNVVVLPTLGALVPSWVLVIPRQCAVSLSTLPNEARSCVLQAGKTAARIIDNNGPVTFFEHGPSSLGSVVGCGVDQAHLHVISTKLEFVTSALRDPNVDWISADIDDPWKDAISGREYYLIKTEAAAFIGYPKVAVSQFFRRHIALAAGVPECWDYKKWPNYENIRRTYGQFNGRVEFDAV